MQCSADLLDLWWWNIFSTFRCAVCIQTLFSSRPKFRCAVCIWWTLKPKFRCTACIQNLGIRCVFQKFFRCTGCIQNLGVRCVLNLGVRCVLNRRFRHVLGHSMGGGGGGGYYHSLGIRERGEGNGKAGGRRLRQMQQWSVELHPFIRDWHMMMMVKSFTFYFPPSLPSSSPQQPSIWLRSQSHYQGRWSLKSVNTVSIIYFKSKKRKKKKRNAFIYLLL